LKTFSCVPARILDEIDIKVEEKRMDATLLHSEPLSIFRQEPSPEVDRAWQKVSDTRPIALSREGVLAIGKDPAQAVQIPEHWGLGNESYFGRVDVFHQIHCLDALRREAYFEHYYGKRYPQGFNNTGEFHRLHLSHCVYLLLQNIMCNANTDVYTHIWTDTLDHQFPDFNINHQCKDFGAILEWQDQNGLDEKAFVHLRRPDGYPYHVMNHKFKEIHGWFLNHEDDGDLTTGEIA
jgi:Mycotoxin biosynthesis protein UstYa